MAAILNINIILYIDHKRTIYKKMLWAKMGILVFEVGHFVFLNFETDPLFWQSWFVIIGFSMFKKPSM